MNPYFTTNPIDIEEERQPNSFDVDDESDVYFLQQAYQYHKTLVEDENRPVLTRNPIHRDREGAEDRLMGDYFDEPSDCTGRMSLSVIMKCTAAIRQLTYDTTPDAFDEYLQMKFPLFDDLLEDKAPVAPFVVNDVGFEKGYYLADGIYPQ
ncbi:ALP1-like protein isoform X1 [Tanacetum coccineum]